MSESRLPFLRIRRNSDGGYTIVETLITLAVAILIAFVAVPLVSSAWDRPVDSSLKSDMLVGIKVMDTFMTQTDLQKAIGVTEQDVPNVGVYASEAQMRVKVNAPKQPGGKSWYCLTASLKGQNLYYLSQNKAFVSLPVDSSVCPK